MNQPFMPNSVMEVISRRPSLRAPIVMHDAPRIFVVVRELKHPKGISMKAEKKSRFTAWRE